MPSAQDGFQAISGPTQGPFSEYLNPAQPVQPRPIDQPMAPATGFESGPVAAGRVALNFLQGIRQNRVASYLEQERNNQLGFNNYHQHASILAQDPDLAPGGREAILGEANRVLTQHMHREVKDAPEHGALGVLKNVFTQAVGGKIPKTEPIEFEAEQGRLSNLARRYSQKENFKNLVAEGQQAIEALKRGDPQNGIPANSNPAQEEVVRALGPTYAKILQSAPNYANAFLPALSGGYYPAESYAGQAGMLTRTVPRTEAPPGAEPATAGLMRQYAPGGPAAEPVRSADTGPEYAVPLGGPQRYAQLTGMAGLKNSRIAVSPRQRYITESGTAFTGHEINGSPVTGDNGIWNAETGQKVTEQAIPMTAAGRTPYTEQGTGKTYYVSPFTGKMTPFEKEGGGQFERAQAEGLVQMPDGSWQYVSKTGQLPTGAKPEAAAIAGVREKGAWAREVYRQQQANARQTTGIAAARANIGTRFVNSLEMARVQAEKGDVLGAIAAMERSGAPLPENVVAAASKDKDALVKFLNEEKKAVQDDMAAQGTATEAPPKPKAGAAAPKRTAAPPKGGTVGLHQLPD